MLAFGEGVKKMFDLVLPKGAGATQFWRFRLLFFLSKEPKRPAPTGSGSLALEKSILNVHY